MRSLPEVPLSPCPEAYARPLAQGFDTVQEAFALCPTASFVSLLEETQAEAREASDNLDGTVEVDLFGHRFKAHATGARGGFRWRLESDDVLVMIGSPKREWTVSVRYLSAGLWEHGLEALRKRTLEALRPYTQQRDDDFIRTSRFDYCFDFYSPAFTREFTPGLSRAVVCHSSAKAQEVGRYDLWTRGGQGETLTIGSKAGLQVQVYDKTLEIDEASGKTWLHDIWLKALDGEWVFGDTPRPRDVWRLECRFSGDFLKERNLRRPEQVDKALPELIAEAIYTRRLGVPNESDDNRWRWPMHPLWSEAARRKAAGTMRPMGRKVTGRRSELVERSEICIGGTLASALALKHGDYNDDDFEALAFKFMERARAHVQADPKRARKKAAALSRYMREDEAR